MCILLLLLHTENKDCRLCKKADVEENGRDLGHTFPATKNRGRVLSTDASDPRVRGKLSFKSHHRISVVVQIEPKLSLEVPRHICMTLNQVFDIYMYCLPSHQKLRDLCG